MTDSPGSHALWVKHSLEATHDFDYLPGDVRAAMLSLANSVITNERNRMRYVAVVKVAEEGVEGAGNYGVYGPFIDEDSVEKWAKMHSLDVETHELITP